MSPILAFFLGLLAGWLLEWVIDWVYWRRRDRARVDAEAGLHQKVIALDRELVAVKREAAAWIEKAGRLEPENSRLEALVSRLEQEVSELGARQAVPALLVPDHLEEINGIGPAIAEKLQRAGVHTFEQLAAQTPDFLRSVLGGMVERLADEEDLLAQARQFAERKHAKVPGET
jgi:predicted flap endonuclease-1-like 5' DNA nuclease